MAPAFWAGMMLDSRFSKSSLPLAGCATALLGMLPGRVNFLFFN